MLPVVDTQLRLVLLSHVAVRLGEVTPAEIRAAGVDLQNLARLRELAAADLGDLAAMREPRIAVAIDSHGLRAALRVLGEARDTRALETYFIQQGASWRMMRALFKMRRNRTLQRRRELGVWHSSGRVRLPGAATRERIHRAWRAIDEPTLRARYYRLHQRFPDFTFAVLAAVIAQFEEPR